MRSVPHSNQKQPPLVVHIIHRLAVGGLENGVINLINHMPPERYRHAIVCLTDATDFRDRIQRADVPVITLHKRAGQDFGVHARLWQVLRRLRPAIVHTRNLSGLEYLAPAALAGVPGRIHGEHGRDIYDINGSNAKYNLLRKAIRPLIHRYIGLSADLTNWLVRTVGARTDRVIQIYNGVDVQRFHPRLGLRPAIGLQGFASENTLIVGTVGRMEAVKDQLTLVRAFIHLLACEPAARQYLRLVLIGDGRLREEARRLLREADIDHLSWLPGERSDIPELMRALDLFVLPSLAEGVSNTILEAMACGLPVIATSVGGNPELVIEGETGILVPPADPLAIAAAIRSYLEDKRRLTYHGQAGRKRAETHFSMQAMVNAYLEVYDGVLMGRRRHGISQLTRLTTSSCQG